MCKRAKRKICLLYLAYWSHVEMDHLVWMCLPTVYQQGLVVWWEGACVVGILLLISTSPIVWLEMKVCTRRLE